MFIAYFLGLGLCDLLQDISVGSGLRGGRGVLAVGLLVWRLSGVLVCLFGFGF